jgi:xanthine dehydrogenase accessory factor
MLVRSALNRWAARGGIPALATVVHSTSSAPRGIGAMLAVAPDCTIWTGGLSGGCAEVEVLDAAAQVLAADGPPALALSMTREELGGVGPVCGATLTVIVERVSPELRSALDQAVSQLTNGVDVVFRRSWQVVESPEAGRTVLMPGSIDLIEHVPQPVSLSNSDASVARDVISWSINASEAAARITWAAPPRLVIVGSGDVAAQLVQQARMLGWRWVLIDPRTAFLHATLEELGIDGDVRGTVAAEPSGCVLADQPAAALTACTISSRDMVVACAHDAKLDIPALEMALASSAAYVGSIGSRVVQHTRSQVLANTLGDAAAARHHGPAGLDLGGSDAADIALSVTAEAMSVLHGRTGGMLRHGTTPIRA